MNEQHVELEIKDGMVISIKQPKEKQVSIFTREESEFLHNAISRESHWLEEQISRNRPFLESKILIEQRESRIGQLLDKIESMTE